MKHLSNILFFFALITPFTIHTGDDTADEYYREKEDRANTHNRKAAYKDQDREKTKLHRITSGEDDNVTTQSRVAKILWAGSSHPPAQAHDHKKSTSTSTIKS